jgi:magnesium chelatase subunit D
MSAESDAALVVSLFAVDPAGLGGVCLRSPVQPARDQWLQFLRESLPPGTPLRKLPFNIPDGRLLGGLDLVATLKANRPIAERGVLADAHGGVVILTMAERLTAQTAGRLNAVIDAGEILMPREGVTISNPARVGVVALDEGIGPDEAVPVSLLDRFAFLVDLGGFNLRSELIPEYEVEDVVAARALLPRVQIDDDTLQALCATAISLGAGSPRVSLLATRVACAAAALDGRTQVSEADAVLAGRLVLAPRATIAPQPRDSAEPPPPPSPEPPPPPSPEPPPEQAPEPPAEPPPPSDQAQPEKPPEPPPPENSESEQPDKPLEIDAQTLADMVLTATEAAIPAGLLARLRSAATERAARPSAAGRTGAFRSAGARGRPSGISAGAPKGSARLNVIETLRAAAPWQGLRGRAASGDARVRVSPEDFRVTRYKQRAQTLTIFAVDASGSSALNRLAEAKCAVELLLADCYVRRDQVAVIGFRGKTAEVLLPPTRSLVRAKRSLAGLPGGGGTPLATAIDSAAALADLSRRRGETPTIVMLTDGRANVARDGSPGRERAHANALQAARGLGALGVASLFVDTSQRPSELAKAIAAGMRAEYIALPFANARSLSAMVRASTAPR